VTQTLRDYASDQMAEIAKEFGTPSDPPEAVERWMHHLIATGLVPDDILETLPEVSRHNAPQDSPQEYECGCVAMTRITDRDTRHDEKPFEMRLVRACADTTCLVQGDL
jgi:hypothetical protein